MPAFLSLPNLSEIDFEIRFLDTKTSLNSIPFIAAYSDKENDLFFNRSMRNRSISISATVTLLSNEKRSPSAKIEPFSAIILLPAKIISVVDSPLPDAAYTYPEMQRADCWLTRDFR